MRGVIAVPSKLPETLPGRVILTDDPQRAKMLAAHHLEYSAQVYELGEFLAYTGSYKGAQIAIVSSGFGSSVILSCCGELTSLGVKEIIFIGACASTDMRHGLRSVVLASGGSRSLLDRANYVCKQFNLTAAVRTVLPPDAVQPEEGCIIDNVTGDFYGLAREGGIDTLSILTVSEDPITGEKMEEHEVRSRFYTASRLAFEVFTKV